MKHVTFNLQIFSPGDACDSSLQMDSSTPFMQFQRGDLINPRFGDAFSQFDDLKDKVLRVVNVEHALEEMENSIRHYVRIYTTAVPDRPETRLENG